MVNFDPAGNVRLGALIEACGFKAELKNMFGHQSWFLNGYMFSGANELGVFVHLGRDTVAQLLDTKGTMPFEPRPGTPMKDYLQLTHSISEQDQLLKDWLIKSGSYLQGRPAKVKKPKKG